MPEDECWPETDTILCRTGRTPLQLGPPCAAFCGPRDDEIRPDANESDRSGAPEYRVAPRFRSVGGSAHTEGV